MGNVITVSGVVSQKPRFTHSEYGHDFYTFPLDVARISGEVDFIPCFVNETFADSIHAGEKVWVMGEVRARHDSDHVNVYVYANNCLPDYSEEDVNAVVIRGFVASDVNYRVWKNRHTADFTVRVKRNRNAKTDVIPCVVFGSTAIRSSMFDYGQPVSVVGRLQSRNVNGRSICEIAANSVLKMEG